MNKSVPDEILLTSDRTIAVIDGSGVIHDPAGIDRNELVRLAKARKMISHFNRACLGREGYVVLVEDQDVKLPCKSPLLIARIANADLYDPAGEVVADGTEFRNTAHFRYKAELFVPCGGRSAFLSMSSFIALNSWSYAI